MKETIFNTLANDATLQGLLTGGFYSEVAEISRQATPAAFSTTTLELLPCLLLKLGARTTTGPQYVKAERLFVNIWLYQQRDEDTITSANDRIYVLLHETCLPAAAGDTGAMWWLTHVSDVSLQDEDETLRARYIRSQYQIIMRRG